MIPLFGVRVTKSCFKNCLWYKSCTYYSVSFLGGPCCVELTKPEKTNWSLRFLTLKLTVMIGLEPPCFGISWNSQKFPSARDLPNWKKHDSQNWGSSSAFFSWWNSENFWNKPPRPSGLDSSLGLHLWKLWSLLRGNLAIPHHQSSMKNQLVIVEPPWRSTGGDCVARPHVLFHCKNARPEAKQLANWQVRNLQNSSTKTTQIHFSIVLDSPNLLQVSLFRVISQLPCFLGPTHTIQTPGKMDQSWSIFPLLFCHRWHSVKSWFHGLWQIPI